MNAETAEWMYHAALFAAVLPMAGLALVCAAVLAAALVRIVMRGGRHDR